MTKRTHSRPKREYGIKMDCDICGKNHATAIAIVEGAEVGVCPKCARFGKVLHSLASIGDGSTGITGIVTTRPPIETEDIIEGYGEIIRKRRESMGLPLAVIAEKISEKESYLKHIEHGTTMPSIAIAKKLEKELGVKLIEVIREEITPTPSKPQGFSEPSLGDLLEASRNKKKK